MIGITVLYHSARLLMGVNNNDQYMRMKDIDFCKMLMI